MSKKGPSFDRAAISRITRATAKANGGKIPAGSFAAIAQRVEAKTSVTTPAPTPKKP